MQELKVEIEEYMEISNYRDFMLINYPQTIADVVNTEQEINEFEMCIYFKDEQAPTSQISDVQIALQYFEAVSKCKIVSVTRSSTEEQIYLEIKRIINDRN
ncbi:predicted protein [Naegleria gruberi]|uniref:Predicted protein n=1 Tax=Naegleria gruberi TaxID=5762 RepID=D2V3H2_NAEGR|nr:uncharacterized protein NAEGRDRAFT_63362 [Naegleria gruberi]EFC48770.1 predicted protein [Naegleria gruberi]|eukprot:XP_002681514.1 predicted protein [Naegleria gruberi strain NEG-M]